MYARMTKLHDTDVDRAIQAVRENVMPKARDQDGYKGFIGFVDREAGTFMTFTLWESEEAMRASEATANQLRGQVTQALGAGEPTVKRFEAAILEVPASVVV
jgi:heme-degrading monooxygenase HmoA